jgi:hypothetical protein
MPTLSKPSTPRQQLLKTLKEMLSSNGLVYISRGKSDLLGWQPKKNNCHDNAGRWVAEHPGDTVMHGWLHDPREMQRDWFLAHSVVRTAAGEIIDVTLDACPQKQLRFLPHPGPVDFFAIVKGDPPCNELFEGPSLADDCLADSDFD